MLILIIAATDRDKNLLRGGNEQLSCCHCLIQPPRSFRFLPANHAEKLKAQRRVPLNAGDPQEQWWLSQVTNVHRPFDPIVSHYFFFTFECTSLIPTQTCSKHTLCDSVCVRKNGAMQSMHEEKKMKTVKVETPSGCGENITLA